MVFAREVLPAAREWMNEAEAGTLLGILHIDIGRIGEVLIPRAFDSRDALRAERHRASTSEDPFGSASTKFKFTMESYALFRSSPSPRLVPTAASSKSAPTTYCPAA